MAHVGFILATSLTLRAVPQHCRCSYLMTFLSLSVYDCYNRRRAVANLYPTEGPLKGP